MFKGGQTNPYDDIVSEQKVDPPYPEPTGLTMFVVDKTTDENLTGENWELILNLCDKVQDEGEQGYVQSLSIGFMKLVNSMQRS